MMFGIIVETIVGIPGLSGRIVVKCSDGTTLDEEIDSTVQFSEIIGSIIGVECTEFGVRFHLFPSTPRNRISSKPVRPSWVAACIDQLEDSNPAIRNAAIALLIKIHPNDLPAICGVLSATQHKSYLVRTGVESVLAILAPKVVSMLLLILRIPGCGHFEKIVEPYINKSGSEARKGLAEIKRMRSGYGAKPSNIVECGYCGKKVNLARLAYHLAYHKGNVHPPKRPNL